MGADDLGPLSSPRPEILRAITGVESEPDGLHVRLDKQFRTISTQRLALADVGGSILVALWPGELKAQADYLYADERALALIRAARERSWTVEPSPHLAFFNSHPSQRLYLAPPIAAEDYARRWEGPDRAMIGRHGPEALPTIRAWLEERGYLDGGDAEMFARFRRILGRRNVDVRPGLRLKRRFSDGGSVVKTIRDNVNDILGAVEEPPFSATS